MTLYLINKKKNYYNNKNYNNKNYNNNKNISNNYNNNCNYNNHNFKIKKYLDNLVCLLICSELLQNHKINIIMKYKD